EGARGDAGFPFAPGLVVRDGQGLLQLGLKVVPQAMKEVLAALTRFATHRSAPRFHAGLASGLHLLARQVDLPGTDHDGHDDAQEGDLQFERHVLAPRYDSAPGLPAAGPRPTSAAGDAVRPLYA